MDSKQRRQRERQLQFALDKVADEQRRVEARHEAGGRTRHPNRKARGRKAPAG